MRRKPIYDSSRHQGRAVLTRLRLGVLALLVPATLFLAVGGGQQAYAFDPSHGIGVAGGFVAFFPGHRPHGGFRGIHGGKARAVIRPHFGQRVGRYTPRCCPWYVEMPNRTIEDVSGSILILKSYLGDSRPAAPLAVE